MMTTIRLFSLLYSQGNNTTLFPILFEKILNIFENGNLYMRKHQINANENG